MFEEKMYVQYRDLKGVVTFVSKSYITFNPSDSNALMLIYKENWKNVTVLEVAQPS